jgi:hypothetical protein
MFEQFDDLNEAEFEAMARELDKLEEDNEGYYFDEP